MGELLFVVVIGGCCRTTGFIGNVSFRGASKMRARNLEIPGSMLRIAPE
jgi:hypothetical protein